MNKLVEIFLKFLKLMHERNNNFNQVKIELIKAGYTLTEIDASLEWYFGEIHNANQNGDPNKFVGTASELSYRYFTLDEERYLSLEARSYLTEMLAGGSIQPEEIESILETLKNSMIEDAGVEEIDNIMIGFRTLNISSRDGSEDTIDFKVRYIQ